MGISKLGDFDNNFGQQHKDTVTATRATSHLSGSMSSAIILSAALANFFWSIGAAASAAPELELGLELELGGKEGLMDAKVCGSRTAVFCLICFFSFSSLTCSKEKSSRVKPSLPGGNITEENT